jgi:hypothetical protein
LPTINFINARAPELASKATADLIAIAEMQTGPFDTVNQIGTMGTQREYAIALRTLHLIVRRLRDTGAGAAFGGAVSSISEGSLSESFSISPQDSKRFGDLVTTIWGCELIELIKGNFLLPTTRIDPSQMGQARP